MNGEILSIETAEKIAKLEKENKKLKKLKERYQLEKEIYKTRNEKAIEYIEKRDFDEVTMDNGWESDFDCKETY